MAIACNAQARSISPNLHAIAPEEVQACVDIEIGFSVTPRITVFE